MASDDDNTKTGRRAAHRPQRGVAQEADRRAKKRGYITYDELNDALPQDQMSSEQIEDVMSALSEMGVNIVENEEADEDDGEDDDGPEEIADDDDDGDDQHVLEKKKKETIDRTDDPVRMYLREMGAVELLSREGEIAIAKRIEAGRDTMIWGLCESPITFNAIIDWSTALNNGEMQLREILDLEAMLSKGPTAEQVEGAETTTAARSPKRPPARASRKRKSPRRSPTRTRTRTRTASPRPRRRRRTTRRTTPSASPRWKRR